MDERIEELLALYALGGLTSEEQAEVETHALANPQVRAELDELLSVTSVLGFGVSPVAPIPEIKNELLHRVNKDAAQRRAVLLKANDPAESTPTTSAGLLDWLRSQVFGLSLAGVFLLLVLFFGGWTLGLNQTVQSQAEQLSTMDQANVQLAGRIVDLETQVDILEAENATLQENNQLLAGVNAEQLAENERLAQELVTISAENNTLTQSLTELQNTNAELEATIATLSAENAALDQVVAVYESLFSADAVVTTLEGTEARPEGVAQIVTSADGETAFLVVSGLEPLAEGLAYQVLLIYDEGHDTAETFLVDTTGHGISLVTANQPLLDNYTAIGVSIEPAGGSEQRTGDIVLLGSINS